MGGLLIPTGLATAVFWLPAAIADGMAFGHARACSEPNVRSVTCWTDVAAVVQGTRIVHHRKYDDWVVDLSTDYGLWHPIVAHRDSFNQLNSGDQVTARLWHGKVVLIRAAGRADLPTEDDPGHQVGVATMVTLFVLLFGAVFFLGGLGIHRRYGSWTRSVDRTEWGSDIYYGLPGPAQRWGAAVMVLIFLAVAGGFLAWMVFGADMLAGALVGAGFGALLWAWALHHRARTLAGA